MSIAIAHYIQFRYKDNTVVPSRNYQNFFVNESRTLDSTNYQFAPFRITGTVSTKGGDTAQANLVTIPNAITVGIGTEAVLNYYYVNIKTVIINATTIATATGNQLLGTEPGSFTEGGVISSEIWSCAHMTQDYEKITIALTSPLDATRKQVPKRVLSESLVGSVPTSGNIIAS